MSEAAEWIEQSEPGVYLTISSLNGSRKCLKRVRFRYVKYLTHVTFHDFHPHAYMS